MQPLQPGIIVVESVKKFKDALYEYLLANPDEIQSYFDRPIAFSDEKSRDHLRKEIDRICQDEIEGCRIFQNDTYLVALREVPGEGPFPPLIHLSIKRLDKEIVRDWRDLQEIKNQLVGPQCEGVELYPAEDRLVDTANQFHLWVIKDPNYRFPFGFTKGVRSNADIGQSKQRPFGV